MQLPVEVPITPMSPDVIEAGRVMATLDDWRTIMFITLFLGVSMAIFFIGFTIWREKAMMRERQQMRELAASFAQSASTVANALGDLSTKIAVLSVLTARTEAIADREHHE